MLDRADRFEHPVGRHRVGHHRQLDHVLAAGEQFRVDRHRAWPGPVHILDRLVVEQQQPAHRERLGHAVGTREAVERENQRTLGLVGQRPRDSVRQRRVANPHLPQRDAEGQRFERVARHDLGFAGLELGRFSEVTGQALAFAELRARREPAQVFREHHDRLALFEVDAGLALRAGPDADQPDTLAALEDVQAVAADRGRDGDLLCARRAGRDAVPAVAKRRA